MKSCLSILLLLGTWAITTEASAPKATTGNPGYYRFPLGEFEVNVISDGTMALPVGKMLTRISPPDLKKSLDRSFLGEQVETSVNTFLINTGTKLVLVDTGTGGLFGPTTGKLIANMTAAGYKPEQVDAILITHMHGDHVGGLAPGGKVAFLNAKVYVGKEDSDYWLSADNMAKAPEDKKNFFKMAADSVNPYVKAGKVTLLTSDTEIVPGIHSHASHGHTPGHTSYVIESGGKKLVLLGDLVHVTSVQFGKPTARMGFDSDGDAAEKQRIAAFAAAAKEGYLIGAAHIPFPGVGHVRAEKKGYEFVPVNYTR